ncbi:MAG: hypothetical protein FGF51_01185 [Candidatus Brockarchaeota archaeon]|nr:hypothetical protein [Candidatus Brockarchaeota archaeon]
MLSIERIFPAFKMEKAAGGVVWSLREKGAPFEKDLSELKRLGETLAKAAVERKTGTPED